MALVLTAAAASSALNNEVAKRLATVPPSSTSPPTTLVVPAPTPTTVPGVTGTRVRRPMSAPTSSTTSTSVVEAPLVFQAETPSQIISELEKLRVEEEHDGYSRHRFGFYNDADNDNCDTLEEVVIAEATDLVINKRTCVIESGKWFSPFDGRSITSQRAIDAEHLVSLREAYESGAWAWPARERNAYLNDLKNAETILVISEESEAARDDRDPGGWLPSNEQYRCDYLRTWVYLKTLYKLSVDPGERESIAAAALHC